MKAWSYVRVSTEDQISGDGLNRQNRLFVEACQQHGWTPAEHQVIDSLSGYSGANLQRGGLGRLLRAIENGTIPAGDVVVIEDIDRLSRLPPMESSGILNQIIGAGVLIYIVSMSMLVDKKSVEGFDCLYIVLKMVLAHDESKKKSERIKQSVQSRKEQGVKWTGKRPIWLNSDFSVNEPLASTVKLMFKLSKLGHGATSIAKHLNKFDRRTDGKLWRTSTVSHILRSKATIGTLIEASGKEWLNYYPEIITEEEFNQVGELLTGRKLPKGNAKYNNITNLFAGRLKCVCGSGLRLNGANFYQYAKCLNATHDSCQATSIKFKALEEASLDLILNRKEFVEPPEVNTDEIDRELTSLEHRKSLLNQALEEVIELSEIRVITKQLATIEDKIAALNNDKGMVLRSIAISKHRGNAQSMFLHIKNKYLEDPTNIENRRRLQLIISDIVERIELDKDKIDGKRKLTVKYSDGHQVSTLI